MSSRQHLLNDAIDEGALMSGDSDPVLVRTVEETTEHPTCGVSFGGGSSRAGFGSVSHAAFNGLGEDRDKQRLIFVSGFECEDDAALGGRGEGEIEKRVLHRTPPGRIAL